DALRADPACAGLSSAISNAQIAFDRPETRPRIVQYISQSDSASIRQSFKDGTKLLRKLAHELEKEKSIKPYVLREIRKNFDPSDPGTQTLEQLVNDLSEDQLRQILNAILPMNEDQMMSVVDKMREGIAGILRAEEAQKAAAWAAAMREQWRQAWIQSRYPPRPSVGRALLETVASKR
ncbi:hypothetical protein HYR69_01100, partial [Candidatus Sumerlaeota bacterium]|nr:hypothetical protein [Candidatus Sumerlaeota bacterium]